MSGKIVTVGMAVHDEARYDYGLHEPTASEKKRARQANNRMKRAMAKKAAVLHKEMIDFKTGPRSANADDQIDAYNYLYSQNVANSTRQILKAQAHGAAYGMGNFTQAENRMVRTKNRYMTEHLSSEQQRWAQAFHDVLEVGVEFYVGANYRRKRYLEEHYTEIAAHDTPKGRKAAKVVAHRVAAALAPDEPPQVTFPSKSALTGRVNSMNPQQQFFYNMAQQALSQPAHTPETAALSEAMRKYACVDYEAVRTMTEKLKP